MEVNTRAFEVAQDAVRLFQALPQWYWPTTLPWSAKATMVSSGMVVDRMRPDQRLNIPGARDTGVFGARARPQRTLHPRALRFQGVPAFTPKEACKTLVGQLGIGNS